MDREDIIRMAREAGLKVGTNLSGVQLVGSPIEIGLAHLTIEELERFAALVAAAEREACLTIAVEAKKGATMSKYATIGSCQSARDMAEQIESCIRSRGEK